MLLPPVFIVHYFVDVVVAVGVVVVVVVVVFSFWFPFSLARELGWTLLPAWARPVPRAAWYQGKDVGFVALLRVRLFFSFYFRL